MHSCATTGEMSALLCVSFRLPMYKKYPGSQKHLSTKAFVMQNVAVPQTSNVVGHEYAQHGDR